MSYTIYDTYKLIFNDYKEYIESNSQYSPNVQKYYRNTKPKFPLVICNLSDNTDSDDCTLGKEEFYEHFYFTITIYTKDKTQGANVVVPSQVISEELAELTMKFFGEKKKKKKTANKVIPNMDEDILRRVIYYQGMVGNTRLNIIRR